MNKLKKLYKEFFGLTEQTQKLGSVKMSKTTNPAEIKKMTDQGLDVKLETLDTDLDEAQLLNKIIDYRGGVEYVLRNPAEAQSVAQEIQEWATKKGFTIIKQTTSKSGKVGYFYFRLGQDPARDSQRIQGYISQKPEIKHFRFNIRNEQPAAKPKPEM